MAENTYSSLKTSHFMPEQELCARKILATSELYKEAMKNVSYDKLSYWKGKKQTEEQKALKTKRIRERSEAYWKYKAEGGELKYNDFCKKFYTRS